VIALLSSCFMPHQKPILWPKVVHLQLLKLNFVEKDCCGPRAFGKIVHTNSSLTLFVLVCTHITLALAYNVSYGKQSDTAIDSLALCIIISYALSFPTTKCLECIRKYRPKTQSHSLEVRHSQSLTLSTLQYYKLFCLGAIIKETKKRINQKTEALHSFCTSNCNRNRSH
jgi:hypothetical protein